MGKRKTKKAEVKKSKVPKLDKEFNCPFCNNVKTVGVRMNHKERLGHLSCRVCGVEYTSRIGKFDEAVDIYSNWIDKCYEVNNMAQSTSSSVVDQSILNEGSVLAVKDGENKTLQNLGNSDLVSNMIYSRNQKKISFTMDDDINEDSYSNENANRGLRRLRTDEEDDYDDLEDFIVNDNEEETKGNDYSKQQPQSSNDEIIEKMKRDLEINKSRKIKEDSGVFDISNITKSSSMPKSFTVNEDDGLFSD
ncbi:transcription elongation factor 1 [Cryptosporidium sp. chipmunk genotype I]|uniref:transcription elongation factor 1 n=1 Tax=Cryptosporidium sp. chipmunk genotype I TaxID=1280935 RepID=UPI003519EC24|nr:transcription elongation factor 1 [Cryptosporidium sp. chipmunk genotype I]